MEIDRPHAPLANSGTPPPPKPRVNIAFNYILHPIQYSTTTTTSTTADASAAASNRRTTAARSCDRCFGRDGAERSTTRFANRILLWLLLGNFSRLQEDQPSRGFGKMQRLRSCRSSKLFEFYTEYGYFNEEIWMAVACKNSKIWRRCWIMDSSISAVLTHRSHRQVHRGIWVKYRKKFWLNFKDYCKSPFLRAERSEALMFIFYPGRPIGAGAPIALCLGALIALTWHWVVYVVLLRIAGFAASACCCRRSQ